MLSKLMDKIYDKKKKQFKSLLFPISILMGFTIFFSVIGVVFGAPALFLLSYYAFSVVVVAMVHDHWILNSLTVPLSFIFVAVMASDAFTGNYAGVALHGSIAIIAVVIFATRINTSLVIMVLSSFINAIWILTVILFMGAPYYMYLFGIYMGDGAMFASALLWGIVPSILATIKNTVMKKKGKKMKCEGGLCPF